MTLQRPVSADPAAGHWTGIPVRHDEPAEHLDLWLATATTEASFSRLTVTQQARDRGLANPARRWVGAGRYHGGTIAYVAARPIDDQTSELGVTVHGPGGAKLAPAVLSVCVPGRCLAGNPGCRHRFISLGEGRRGGRMPGIYRPPRTRSVPPR
jgi:hypothetical protein